MDTRLPHAVPRPPRKMHFVRRLWKKSRRIGKRLWHRAKNERASPKEVGQAVFLGVFAGCSPALGAHGWLAIGLATVFRRNRLYALLGSRVSNFVVLPFIVLAEVQASRYLRTGSFAQVSREHVLEEAPSLLLDWGLGSILVGVGLGLVLGLLAYAWSSRKAKRPVGPSKTA